MKKFLTAGLLAGAMLFNTANVADAAPANVNSTTDRETIHQVALLQSLTMGYFDGSITVGELRTFGDTGIGTFEGLDGEMIVLDGVVYRGNEKLRINVVNDKVTVPFANVTFFDSDFSVDLVNVPDKAAFEEKLNALVNEHGANSFYMIKLHGTFNEILIRSERGSAKPYPTLVEALKKWQRELTPKNITGTIVGLYCPEFMSSLNAVGWHFHFISDDKKIGGHVLGVNLKRGTAHFDKTDNFRMGSPTAKNFQQLNFNTDLKEEIRSAEQDSHS